MRRTFFIAVLTSALAAIAIAQEADVVITKTVSMTVASPGATLSYVLTVENLGPDIAGNVVVVDELSHHAVFISASPECTYEMPGHEVLCLVPEMGPGMRLDFQIDVMADVLPADAEIGVELTGEAPTLAQPAAALIGTRIDVDEVISMNDHLVNPRGIAREAGGALLVVDLVDPSAQSGGLPIIDGRIIRIDRATGAQTVLGTGGELLNPTGIAVSVDGRVFVADQNGPELPDQFGRVLEIDPMDGTQTTLAEGDLLEQPRGIAVLDTGDLVVVDAVGKLVRIDSSSGAQSLVSEYGDLVLPRAVAQFAPETVVVVDGSSGLVKVDLTTGDQMVLMPIDGIVLFDPLDIEVDHLGHCWVADLASGETGSVLDIDCDAGSLETRYGGGDVWAAPRGLELIDVITNQATVSSSTNDPDDSNNSDWVATEIEEGFVPPVEVSVNETVTVTDGVLVDVITAVIIEVLETITVTDAMATLPAVIIEVSEIVTVADTVVAQPAVSINLTEAINVNDAVTAQPLLPVQIQVTETITVADQVAAYPPVVINLFEIVSVTDSVLATPLLPLEITVNESITVTDQVTATPAAVISVAEQITVTDTPQVSIQAVVTIDVQETVTVSDQIDLLVETPLFADGFESGDTSFWTATVGG